MYRQQRNGKSPSSGERIDFKFSNFQALQVPKVWDKLLVSIISVETGKTVARSNKALVRNGNCQWTETLSESIWISHDDSSKELEEHLFKFVVSMGSARSGILGEATVNIARYYTSSRSSAPLSLPLKKCNHGTVLQVKIQCLTPRTKLRVEGLKAEAMDESYDDALSRSNGSAASVDLSAKSSQSQELNPTSLLGKIKIMMQETSYQPSGSNQNNDSAEYSLEKERFYKNNHMNGIKNKLNGNSRNSSPRSNYPNEEDLSISKSNNSSFKSRITHDDQEEEYEESPPPVLPTSSMPNTGSSKNLLEAAEDTIEELREEAKMWERNSQKLMLDLEILKERFSDQSKNLTDSKMELSAARMERDGMKKEVDQLKRLVEVKQKVKVESAYKSESGSQLLKELEIELKAHKESNTDLSLQLKRNQESNIELVCILQELEETTETQRAEIEELLEVKSKFNDLEKSFNFNLVEIRSLQLNLQQMEESEKTLQANMQILEQALENKISDLENERISNSHTLSLLEKDYKTNLSIKEEEINNLESKLSEKTQSESQQMQEIQELQQKISEVEKECSELTNENLELLCEIKELKKKIQEKNVVIEEDQKVIKDYNLKIQELERLNEEQEDQISDLQKEKEELQENMEDALEESNITSKCLDNLRNDLMVLSSSVDSQVSANKLLEKKAFDLEKVKHEAELRLFEVEEENIRLSESLTSLESQLRRMKDELQESESVKFDLQNEVEKLYDIEKLLLEAQEECGILKSEKKKLLESSEGLIEECSNLEKLYEEMRKEKGELSEKCSSLEVELMEARGNLVISSERVASLEEKHSSMLEEYMFKEKSLSSHLDELNQENWKLKEKVTMEESLLNQMYLEKTSEIENFQKEVQHLQNEISKLHEQKSKVVSEKSKLESSLKEIHSRNESIENQLQTLHKESESKIQDLETDLIAIKESNKKLMTDHEKKSKVLFGYRIREERRKTMENDLELKLTVSEYERQQLIEEASKLKDKLQKTSNLDNEVMDHKRKLDKLKYEKNNLEASFRSLSSSFEEVKEEKISFLEKISTLEASVKEYEECKHEKNVLEEKIMQLEGDLMSKGASRSLDSEMKNELSRIKSANLQYQLKVQQIEGEKNECLKKVHALEEDLRLLSTKSGSKSGVHETHSQDDIDNVEKIEMLEAQLDEALDANNKYRAQLKRLKSEGRNSLSSNPGKSKVEGDLVTKERFERTKSSLETELKDLRDRYLEMSLKYAEVEAEREDLVMQLKTNNSTRRRFQFLESQ
ncbi:uncharacterized protein LOC111894168 [Lactuca sativa]|uniref:C2 NT-type domain-containing protein n=1 Tax=Lactuca sativa TaxID=4236 RepID=A0A9R1V5Z4_LACSA|nr:uncharacterized protein LOC111894168 [Lactuca sativa]KAJ0200251.1 hypothetical protein LSAT_V11C600309380 [Lactuca sativa]